MSARPGLGGAHGMACSLLFVPGMSAMRIVKVADGEELISFENERVRPAVTDDPREGMLERRLEVSARSLEVSARSDRFSVPDPS